MFAFISGTLSYINENSVVIETAGIGYRLLVSERTVSKLPKEGEFVKLFTHMNVKEDGITLYGFFSNDELEVFITLTSVSGVGPKAALAILSVLEPQEIYLAIVTEDSASISKAQGVGKKIAARIVMELKDKIKNNSYIGSVSNVISPQQTLAASSQEKQDAIDALTALGYSKSEAVKSVMEVSIDGMSADNIIRLAIKKIHKQ